MLLNPLLGLPILGHIHREVRRGDVPPEPDLLQAPAQQLIELGQPGQKPDRSAPQRTGRGFRSPRVQVPAAQNVQVHAPRLFSTYSGRSCS